MKKAIAFILLTVAIMSLYAWNALRPKNDDDSVERVLHVKHTQSVIDSMKDEQAQMAAEWEEYKNPHK